MDILEQQIETVTPSGQVTLELLLDTLTAVSDQVAELPAPSGLFAAELEAGLAETLAVAGHGS